MSDPRATTRGSKTAAVVMLVVFLQVLIVAILGLGAIGRNREVARADAKATARRNAEAALGELLADARREVLSALNDVRRRPGFDDLEQLRADRYHGRHADLVNTVYQVDPETRVFYWSDGTHRLYVPPSERARMIAAEKEAETVAQSMVAAYNLAPDDVSRIQSGLALFQRFPYRQDEEAGYVFALGGVRGLVRLASDLALDEAFTAPSEEPEQAAHLLEQALLRAIEVVALNQDRQEDIPVGDRAKLTEVPEMVEATVVALPPEHDAIRRRVEAARRARLYLEGAEGSPPLRPNLEVALNQIGETEDVTYVPERLIGLVPWVRVSPQTAPRHLLVLMNLEAALHLVEDMSEPTQLAQMGLALHLVTVEDPTPQDVAAVRDLRQEGGLRLPYRAELRWIHPPPVPSGGPGEYFYWGIITLSAAGLGMGGWVLMRIYTREVRLARLKADFVSNLSHELKTPLTSIAMWTEMLHDGQLTSEEDRKEGLSILAQESDRLQSIVHRMLDAAKREARGTAYELRPGDLNATVGKSADRFHRIVAEPGLDLRVGLCAEPLPMLLDPAAIDDVVSNLVSNAWKYKRGEKARVEVRTQRRGRRAELVVVDDGLGIPRRERSKVFEMFYRADAYLTRAAGTGLGLSLVRTIVRAHKGSIRIEPGLNGRGTLFRIRFPLSRKGHREPATSSASLGTMSPEPEA